MAGPRISDRPSVRLPSLVLAISWVAVSVPVMALHDNIICPGPYGCFDDPVWLDRMEWSFTVVLLLVLTGLFLVRRWAPLLSSALAGLGVAIALRHLTVKWWAGTELAMFGALGIGGLAVTALIARRGESASFSGEPAIRVGSGLSGRGRIFGLPSDPILRRFALQRVTKSFLLILPAVALSAVAIPHARAAATFERTAPRTEGSVVRIANDGTAVDVVFMAPGADRPTRVRVPVQFYDYEEGETVDVLYDPKNLRHVELEGETYDFLSVAFPVTLLVVFATWIFFGTFLWVRRVVVLAASLRETHQMQYRRSMTRSNLRGSWISLFPTDGTPSTTPVASYRVMSRVARDVASGSEVTVHGRIFDGGLVLARQQGAILWPLGTARTTRRFNRKLRVLEFPPPVPSDPHV